MFAQRITELYWISSIQDDQYFVLIEHSNYIISGKPSKMINTQNTVEIYNTLHQKYMIKIVWRKVHFRPNMQKHL